MLAGGTLLAIGTATLPAPVAAQQEPGMLSIAAPATIDLGTAAPGAGVAAALGPVTVDDDRPVAGPTWTATASATALTSGSATIAASALAYASGPATATTGVGTFTPGQASVGQAMALGAPVEAFRVDGAIARTTATWSPTLLLTVPSGAVAGSYTGTLTHSVA